LARQLFQLCWLLSISFSSASKSKFTLAKLHSKN
jgi:hypothetical protein